MKCGVRDAEGKLSGTAGSGITREDCVGEMFRVLGGIGAVQSDRKYAEIRIYTVVRGLRRLVTVDSRIVISFLRLNSLPL